MRAVAGEHAFEFRKAGGSTVSRQDGIGPVDDHPETTSAVLCLSRLARSVTELHALLRADVILISTVGVIRIAIHRNFRESIRKRRSRLPRESGPLC